MSFSEGNIDELFLKIRNQIEIKNVSDIIALLSLPSHQQYKLQDNYDHILDYVAWMATSSPANLSICSCLLSCLSPLNVIDPQFVASKVGKCIEALQTAAPALLPLVDSNDDAQNMVLMMIGSITQYLERQPHYHSQAISVMLDYAKSKRVGGMATTCLLTLSMSSPRPFKQYVTKYLEQLNQNTIQSMSMLLSPMFKANPDVFVANIDKLIALFNDCEFATRSSFLAVFVELARFNPKCLMPLLKSDEFKNCARAPITESLVILILHTIASHDATNLLDWEPELAELLGSQNTNVNFQVASICGFLGRTSKENAVKYANMLSQQLSPDASTSFLSSLLQALMNIAEMHRDAVATDATTQPTTKLARQHNDISIRTQAKSLLELLQGRPITPHVATGSNASKSSKSITPQPSPIVPKSHQSRKLASPNAIIMEQIGSGSGSDKLNRRKVNVDDNVNDNNDDNNNENNNSNDNNNDTDSDNIIKNTNASVRRNSLAYCSPKLFDNDDELKQGAINTDTKSYAWENDQYDYGDQEESLRPVSQKGSRSSLSDLSKMSQDHHHQLYQQQQHQSPSQSQSQSQRSPSQSQSQSESIKSPQADSLGRAPNSLSPKSDSREEEAPLPIPKLVERISSILSDNDTKEILQSFSTKKGEQNIDDIDDNNNNIDNNNINGDKITEDNNNEDANDNNTITDNNNNSKIDDNNNDNDNDNDNNNNGNNDNNNDNDDSNQLQQDSSPTSSTTASRTSSDRSKNFFHLPTIDRSQTWWLAYFVSHSLLCLLWKPIVFLGADTRLAEAFDDGLYLVTKPDILLAKMFNTYSYFDPLFIRKPMWCRVWYLVDAAVLGSIGLLLAFELIRSRRQSRATRNWSLVFASMMFHSALFHLAYELLTDEPSYLPAVLLFNAMDLIVPVLLFSKANAIHEAIQV